MMTNYIESRNLKTSENGIEYRLDADGMYYPMFCKSDMFQVSEMGKYGVRYVRLLFEEDRWLYHCYMMDGTLTNRAKNFNEECYEFLEKFTERYIRRIAKDKSDSMVVYRAMMQAREMAEEMITADCISRIQYEKAQRVKNIVEKV